jgi:hypothetical protein
MNKQKVKKYKIDTQELESDINKLTWKKFINYKLTELGIIPICILIFWKLSIWIGWQLIYLFNINILESPIFCNQIDSGKITQGAFGNSPVYICDKINYNLTNIWIFGCFSLLFLIGFIILNYCIARRNARDETLNKNKLYVNWCGEIRKYKK